MKVLNSLPDYVVQQCIELRFFLSRWKLLRKWKNFNIFFGKKFHLIKKNPPDFRPKIHHEEIDFNIYQENS